MYLVWEVGCGIPTLVSVARPSPSSEFCLRQKKPDQRGQKVDQGGPNRHDGGRASGLGRIRKFVLSEISTYMLRNEASKLAHPHIFLSLTARMGDVGKINTGGDVGANFPTVLN